MPQIIAGLKYPELVIGIAGPIGIDIDEISLAITAALSSVNYSTNPIRITNEIKNIPSSVRATKKSDYYSTIRYKMRHATAICRKNKDQAYLMRIAIDAVQRERSKIIAAMGGNPKSKSRKTQTAATPVPQRVAYLIRQLKRPEEVLLLREVYGKQFILVSAYGSQSDRKAIIEGKLKRSMSIGTKSTRISALADDLIHIDADESEDKFGQHMRDAFHLADVFVDGINKGPMGEKVERFIHAFFGKNEIAPTKEEHGMHTAKSAAARSSDLSRQVGSAVFSDEGDIIALGCNEVPRAFGGTYWDGEEPDFRDIKHGTDPNDIIKREVIRDVLERLSDAKMLSAKATGSTIDLVARLTEAKSPANNGPGAGCLKGALVTDLTEYGRVVHAEMNAICDAARTGKAIEGSVLYCTTFPCHNCTKHIISSGIRQVIYMEPYPKSRAKELHENEIVIEQKSDRRVSFLPFIGISPYRYRDIFEKGSRKARGSAKRWYYDEPRPMLHVMAPTYIELENVALIGLIGSLTA